jgi:hypothetical protein
MIHDTTHVATGLDWLLVQGHGKTYLEGLLSAYLERVQDIEDTIYDLSVMQGLSTATGIHLDRLGALVGAPRNGLADTQYRQRIGLQTYINASGCSLHDLSYALTRWYDIIGLTANIGIFESQPPHVDIYDRTVLTVAAEAAIESIASDLKPGGVSFSFIWWNNANLPTSSMFTLSLSTETLDATKGFSSTTDTNAGGILSSAEIL